MKFPKPQTLLVGLNLIGVAAYLLMVSVSWRIPEEQTAGAAPGTSGPALVWAATALPILIVALVGNALAFRSLPRERLQKPLLLAVIAMWVLCVIIDFSQH